MRSRQTCEATVWDERSAQDRWPTRNIRGEVVTVVFGTILLLSKQRNKHLQTVLIEVAKMAPRNSPELAMVYEQEKQKGNANRATLAVARKMVAYLVAVDRRQKDFLVVENQNRTAA
jgi:hypothetical protein